MPSPSPLQLRIALAHVDRGLDVVRKLIVDRDPDTAPEHVILRVLAWCLFHGEGLRIADGPPRRDVPDLAIVGLDGKAVAWYACGAADAEELRRIAVHNKGVDLRVLLDEAEPLARILHQVAGIKKRPPGLEALAIWTIEREAVERLAARPELRQRWAVTVVADHLYVDADGVKVDTAVTRVPLPEPSSWSGLGKLGAVIAATLLSAPSPPPPPPLAPVARARPTAAAALEGPLAGAAGVVAFGEVHQDEAGAGTRSALARFTDEILPALAPRASHLIVETWMTTGACGESEARVTEDVARTTERPAETESEIVRLLRRAKASGVTPHVLAVSCAEYAALAPGKGPEAKPEGKGDAQGRSGGVDYDKLLKLTERHLETAIRQALFLPRSTGRPLVLVYGGALHNDLHPARALAPYAFGPAIHAFLKGDYREVDLYVPEFVERLPAMRGERWYDVWRAGAREGEVIAIPRSARSTILVFPRGVASAAP